MKLPPSASKVHKNQPELRNAVSENEALGVVREERLGSVFNNGLSEETIC
jgi:hypothetical protein